MTWLQCAGQGLAVAWPMTQKSELPQRLGPGDSRETPELLKVTAGPDGRSDVHVSPRDLGAISILSDMHNRYIWVSESNTICSLTVLFP